MFQEIMYDSQFATINWISMCLTRQTLPSLGFDDL